MTLFVPECILKVLLDTPGSTKILDMSVPCMETGEKCLFSFPEWKFIFISVVSAKGKKLLLLTAL